MDPFQEIDPAAAAERIRNHVRVTPMLELDPESDPGWPLLMKLESLQVTGSFKLRGAANAMLTLPAEVRGRGVVACSSGNHARAIAHMGARLGIRTTLFVPSWVDSAKLSAIREAGAEIVMAGDSYDEAEQTAIAASQRGPTLIDPFDHPRVIEGQGTVGTEILRQLPDVAAIVAPLSGGGLISGVALAARGAGARIIAVSARNASVMLRSVEAGRPLLGVEEEPTLASALAGGIGLQNRYTFDLVRRLVHTHVEVSEAAIEDAVRWAFRRGLVVEGGGAVGLAAWLTGALPDDVIFEGRPPGPVVIVVSGGNLDSAELVRLVG